MREQFSPITLGESLKTIHAAGFVLTETTHQPNHRLARHNHERANIAIVLNGSFTEILDGQSIDCHPQSLLVKPAGEAHANRYGSRGMRCLVVEINPGQMEALGSWSESLDHVTHVRDEAASVLGVRIYDEFRLGDEASPLAIEGLMLELIANLSRRSRPRPEPRSPRWLERAREILHAHASEPLRLTDVARRVNRHPVHLAREFRRVYGCTLGEYLRALRIRFACRELARSDTALGEIALAAGFSHQAHFSRLFKRHMGMTPREFRSLHRVPR